jgi:hypothetical protein
MVKFFKKAPEKCSICGQEKEVFKTLRSGVTKLTYCKECYDSYYKVVEGRVKEQVMAAVKDGKMVGMKEALDITKKITDELEVEQIKSVIQK